MYTNNVYTIYTLFHIMVPYLRVPTTYIYEIMLKKFINPLRILDFFVMVSHKKNGKMVDFDETLKNFVHKKTRKKISVKHILLFFHAQK